jgi:hypothetical protein
MKELSVKFGFVTIMALLSVGLSCAATGTSAPARTVPPARKAETTAPNAYDLYYEAGRLLKEEDKILRAFSVSTKTRPNRTTLAQKEALLRLNAPVLKRLRQAFPHPYRDPHLTGIITPYPIYSKLRAMARLLLLEGHVRAARGDRSGAMDSFLDALRMGEQVQDQGVYISRIVGIAIASFTRKEIAARLPSLTAAEARAAARRMESILRLHNPFPETMAGEKRFIMLSMERELKKYDDQGRRIVPLTAEEKEWDASTQDEVQMEDLIRRYGKKETLRRYEAHLDRMIGMTERPFSGRPKEVRNVEAKPRMAQLLNPNADLIGPNLSPMMEGFWLRALSSAAQNRMLTLQLALHACRKERGRYPAALRELTPRYLREIPRDPFWKSAPMRYRLQGSGFVLYSIGPDGKDDGGAPILNPDDPEIGSEIGTDTARRYVQPDSTGDIVAGINPN